MSNLVTCIGLTLLIILPPIWTIFYAVRKKGDVRAEFSLRPFKFTLHATERTPERIARAVNRDDDCV